MRSRPKSIVTLLALLLLASFLMGAGIGALYISPLQILAILGDSLGIHMGVDYTEQQAAVFYAIRIPRVLLGMLVGASLGIAGAAIQGLFRNPLADPGLIGISSGASLAAVMTIIMGIHLLDGLKGFFGMYSLSFVTFLGAFLVTLLVYRISQVSGRTRVGLLLLAGIAINALTGALTGLFTFSANDAQLRSITFWTLGSLGGATRQNLLVLLPFAAAALVFLPRFGKALNAFALGENNAAFLGIPVEKLKRRIIFLSALAIGASVSVSGLIGFVGLVVPHICRLLLGPDHRYLLPASALMGGILLINADILARTLTAPAEIPIGIVTGLIGAPFFLYILLKEKRHPQFA